MGRGIAQLAATAGYEVTLHDVEAHLLRAGVDAIRAGLDKSVEKGTLSADGRSESIARVRTTLELSDAVSGADLVIESVPERLELKQELFRRFEPFAPAAAILATNTSSLPVSQVAAVTAHPERVLGMHFFNPVHAMALLEVVRGERTSEETLAAALEVGAKLGKETIVVRDSPGFASSRLGLALGLEAMRMVEQGVASAADIDRAMTLGYRHPVGPLRLTDLVGLDVRLAVAEHLHRTLGSEVFRPPDVLRRLVAEGKLGRKSGQGFYCWDD
jgi:3-hydroxybutyryl-CoA dehydrogenase